MPLEVAKRKQPAAAATTATWADEPPTKRRMATPSVSRFGFKAPAPVAVVTAAVASTAVVNSSSNQSDHEAAAHVKVEAVSEVRECVLVSVSIWADGG